MYMWAPCLGTWISCKEMHRHYSSIQCTCVWLPHYLLLTNGGVIVRGKDAAGELDGDGCVYVRETDSGYSYREATKTMAVCM